MKADYQFKPEQIGGIRERCAHAMRRADNTLTEDEADIIDLIATPHLFGENRSGSHERLREAFERVLKEAETKAIKQREILEKYFQEVGE